MPTQWLEMWTLSVWRRQTLTTNATSSSLACATPSKTRRVLRRRRLAADQPRTCWTGHNATTAHCGSTSTASLVCPLSRAQYGVVRYVPRTLQQSVSNVSHDFIPVYCLRLSSTNNVIKVTHGAERPFSLATCFSNHLGLLLMNLVNTGCKFWILINSKSIVAHCYSLVLTAYCLHAYWVGCWLVWLCILWRACFRSTTPFSWLCLVADCSVSELSGLFMQFSFGFLSACFRFYCSYEESVLRMLGSLLTLCCLHFF